MVTTSTDTDLRQPVTLEASFNGISLTALLDTGATEDCIASSVASRLNLKLQRRKDPIHVEAYDGRSVTVTHEAVGRLDFKTGSDHSMSQETRLSVVPLVHAQVILGTPWMTRNRVALDMGTRRISFGQGCQDDYTKDVKNFMPSTSCGDQDGSTARNGLARCLHKAEDPPKGVDESQCAATGRQAPSDCWTPSGVTVISRHQIARLSRKSEVYMALIMPQEDGSSKVTVNSLQEGQTSQDAQLADLSKEIIAEFQDVFPEELPDGLPPKRNMVHRIDEKEGSIPVNGPIYRLSHKELETLRKYLQEEVNAGRINPSCSPYGSPVLFVPKKDGTIRLCVDYRALNKQTIKNRYPLPRIDDLLDQLYGAKYFSKIDLKSGYNQVRIDKEHQHKTAFKTRYGHYEDTVMPFGLCNAPATFQHLMNDVLRPFLDKFVIVYLDDILIYSPSLEQHKHDIKQVLLKLREHQLYASPKKCEFFKESTSFLGHTVSAKGVAMDPDKVSAILEWPTPKSQHDVHSFVGTISFYQTHIENFSEIAAPLHRLLGKDVKFEWTELEQEAFDKLKALYAKEPVLRIFDPSRKSRISTDASDKAVAGVLEQEIDGQWHPIAYTSRKMNPAEKNYPIREKELLAVLHALGKWRLYLGDSPGFLIRTDHYSLKYLDSQKTLTPRQARWQEMLCNFTYEIDHIPGKSNVVPDGLSRRPDYMVNAMTSSTVQSSDLLDKIRAATPGSQLQHLLDKAADKSRAEQMLVRNLKQDNGIIYRDQRIYVPTEELQVLVLKECHDNPLGGHLGQDKTTDVIRRQFFWPGMADFIRRYIGSCDICQRVKPVTHKPYGRLSSLDVPDAPWQSVSMDFITDLPASQGFTAIMTVIDRLTKMAHFVPCNMEGLTAPATANLFMQIVALHGVPQEIVSDRDPRFKSNFWQALWTIMGTKLNISSAHHAQTDGQTERTHRTVEHILRCYCSYHQDNWKDVLPLAEFAFNNTPSASTNHSPFYANYGRHPTTPLMLGSTRVPAATNHMETMLKVQDDIKKNIKSAAERQARYADQHRQDLSLEIGSQVLLNAEHLKTTRPSQKLSHKRVGPFTILKKIGNVAYKLDLPPTWSGLHPVFHVSMLEPWTDPLSGTKEPRDEQPPPPDLIDHAEEWEVEQILDHRTYRRQKQYLVKWKGYPLHEATWEPTANLQNAQEVLDAYLMHH